MKIMSIVGARPEFVQAAPVSRALRRNHVEVLVHTGQHYDHAMSQAFFDDLGIPAPDYNLGVGSGPHGQQTAAMLVGIEQLLTQEAPEMVLVRGDTNSTLAGALAAAKQGVPLAHIEAGERSHDRRMPEEVNRLVADALAGLHFCASQTGMRNLAREGLSSAAHWVGDVMLDALLHYLPLARSRPSVLGRLGLEQGCYALVTVHRAGNVDDPARLRAIVDALNRAPETVLFPVHPRTRAALDRAGLRFADHVRAVEPVAYLDMLMLEEGARLIATDSGGVQREAYYLNVPCLTLRDETEWEETVTAGWNTLVGVDPERILEAWARCSPPTHHPDIYGDGTASERIVRILEGGAQAPDALERPTSVGEQGACGLEIEVAR
ncbi:MAG: UDP-N-acetylglucosamine 2-epimerase (non-hydrolyzing) [Chloroflexi bacterium]|nr:UDP-N-acetylglucosamine 2-epimerase (non-hydrolyzing) [Chloroflexota bacterium]